MAKLVDQVWGHLAVDDALHDKVNTPLFWRGGDGVAALRLISIRSGQPNIDMLSRQVARPFGNVEREP